MASAAKNEDARAAENEDARYVVKMTPNPDLPRVFALMGHGDDLSGHGDDLSVPNNRHPVPPGCKFVTIVVHGELSMDVPKLYAAFVDELIRPALLEPEREEYRVLLNDYFQFDPLVGTSIFVRTKGMEFQNGNAELWCTSGVGGEPIVWKSGIYQLGEPSHPFSNGKQFAEMAAYRADPAETIRQSYEGSIVQPPPLDGEGTLMISPPLTLTYLDLMIACPGTYYSFACRGVCKPVSEQQLKLVRTASNAQHQKRRKNNVLSHKHYIDPYHAVLDIGMDYYLAWVKYQANRANRERWQATIDSIQLSQKQRTLRLSRKRHTPRVLRKLRRAKVSVGKKKANISKIVKYIQDTKGGTRRRLLTRRSKSTRATLRIRK